MCKFSAVHLTWRRQLDFLCADVLRTAVPPSVPELTAPSSVPEPTDPSFVPELDVEALAVGCDPGVEPAVQVFVKVVLPVTDLACVRANRDGQRSVGTSTACVHVNVLLIILTLIIEILTLISETLDRNSLPSP